jgi:Na+/melibiose symporter-like transporter
MERMAESKGVSIFRLLSGYRDVFGAIFRSASMVRALVLQTLQNITLMVTSTFFALYATQNLGLPESYMAYFPILRALVMLVFLFLIQSKLVKIAPHRVMLCGILAYLAANGILLVAPYQSWLMIALYTLVEACAVPLLMPRLGALVANAIEPKERARIRGLFNAAILAVVSPFAMLAGWLSEMNRRLPFMLNIGLFAVMVGVTYIDARKKPH